MNLIKPFFKGFLKGFKDFGHLVNNIVNFILLSIVYLFGVGPTSIIGKLFRKRFLELKRDSKETYWIENRVGGENIEECYRMF
jgi:hypothetical protein